MMKRKKAGQTGKKGGSIANEDPGTPAKSKPKNKKKQSKGKQKH